MLKLERTIHHRNKTNSIIVTASQVYTHAKKYKTTNETKEQTQRQIKDLKKWDNVFLMPKQFD